ncbi:MAG: rhomboid family intramembrane serine protease [Chloroflexi bacterium]|nr:rhomboid family intramembrane serine protease [Chloroflexota bacterium]
MLNDSPSAPPPPKNDSAAKKAEIKGEKTRQQVTLHIPAVRPFATYTLLVVYVLLFVAAGASPGLLGQNAITAPDVLLYGQYHRLATGMFLHVHVVHLLVVLVTVYIFGTAQERIFGHVRFTLIYLLGGLAGMVLAALLLALTGDIVNGVVGASAAVCAMLAADFAYVYQHRFLFGERGRAKRGRLLLFGAVNLVVGFMYGTGGNIGTLGAWYALGGVLGGGALGWFIAPFFNLTKDPKHPGDIRAEDINPLNRRYQIVIFYVSALLALLIVGTVIAR